MDNQDNQKKKRKKATGGEKEHKRPWQDLYHVIESDFVPDYHPFRYYLDHLPPWDGLDHILAMSVTVQVKGGVEDGTVNRCRGYYVVRRTDEERKMRARSLAYEKRRGQTQITDDTDGF